MLKHASIEQPYSFPYVADRFPSNVKEIPAARSRSSIFLDGTATQNSVLNALPAESKAALWPHIRRIQIAREQFLLQQDDDLEYVYFPETAVLSEFHLLDDGRMVEVAITGKTGAIGLAALYAATRTTNCVQTAQAGSLLQIESRLLKRHCRQDPRLPGLLYASLEAYIRQISQRSVCNMYHSVEERFCTWLLLVQDLSGQPRLSLTHEQIARALGVYRPSVTCIALEMRKRKLIDYSRGGLTIVDRDGLEDAACDCYYELAPNPPITAETKYRS